MNDKMTNLIAQLAARLGTTADHVWAILVVGQRIDAIIAIMWVCVSLIVIGFGALWCRDSYAEFNDEEYSQAHDYNGYVPQACAACVLILVAAVIFCFNLQTALRCLIAPEYMALQDLLQLLGK